jgi:phage virion morphogenesis protein
VKIEAKFDARQVKRHIRKIDKRVRKTKPVLKDIAKHEIQAAQKRIRTRKVDPDGKKWKPHAYATIVQRAREGNLGRGLLYKSGLLARSFWSRITKNKLTIRNRAPYAGYLQTGTRHMPARPYLGWGRKARDKAERFVVDYLRKR